MMNSVDIRVVVPAPSCTSRHPSIMSQAIQAYREVLKAARRCFNEDWNARRTVRDMAREKFLANANAFEDLENKIKLAKDAAFLLRHNVVQGVKENGDTLKLNIRPETEMMLNPPTKVTTKLRARSVKAFTNSSS